MDFLAILQSLSYQGLDIQLFFLHEVLKDKLFIQVHSVVVK
jgi:hypothetical protein